MVLNLIILFASAAGAQLGRAYLSGSDFLINGYTANEPGYIFVVGTLVPKVRYGSGTRRYLRHYITDGFASIADMANPILENVGMQPIYNYEVSDILGDQLDQDSIFGYTDRYAEFKTYEVKSTVFFVMVNPCSHLFFSVTLVALILYLLISFRFLLTL